MNKGGVVGAHAQAHLPHGLQKRQRFNVAYRAANFNNRHIDGVRCFKACPAFDKFLYFVGHVRNNLHCFAQVVAAAFFFQHAFINLASGEVVGLFHARFNKTLVVAQIKVGFCTVFGHKHLSVLKR